MEDHTKTLCFDETEEYYDDYIEKACGKNTSEHSVFNCSWFSLLDFIIYIFLIISSFALSVLDFIRKKIKH